MEEQVKNEIKATFDEVTADSKAKVAELEAKVKKLEERPVYAVNTIGSKLYKGYNLENQAHILRANGMKDESAEHMAKMIIEMAKAGKPMDIKAAASQIEGTDSQGGYLVIDQFHNVVETLARNNAVIAPLCKNVNAISDTYKVNKNATECEISIDAEGTVTATSATLAQVSIPIKRLGGRTSVSNELLQDSSWDISTWLTEQFAYALGQKLDDQILNGTGTGAGQLNSGVLTAATSNSVVLSGDDLSSITADDLSLGLAKLSTMDAMKATFVFGRTGNHYVRTLKDSQNRPIYQEISGANLNQIYGMPSVTAASIADATSSASTAYGIVGNFDLVYFVNRLGSLELFVDPYSDSGSYNTIFRFATRKGFGVVRGDALCRFVTGD
jgi:HK97 family phage major capsid protein